MAAALVVGASLIASAVIGWVRKPDPAGDNGLGTPRVGVSEFILVSPGVIGIAMVIGGCVGAVRLRRGARRGGAG